MYICRNTSYKPDLDFRASSNSNARNLLAYCAVLRYALLTKHCIGLSYSLHACCFLTNDLKCISYCVLCSHIQQLLLSCTLNTAYRYNLIPMYPLRCFVAPNAFLPDTRPLQGAGSASEVKRTNNVQTLTHPYHVTAILHCHSE